MERLLPPKKLIYLSSIFIEHFILEEDMLEINTTSLVPEVVLTHSVLYYL